MNVCTRVTRGTDVIGEPCPDCGHTNLLHPRWNTGVDECVICRLHAEIETVRLLQYTVQGKCGVMPHHGSRSGCVRAQGHDGKHRYGEPL